MISERLKEFKGHKSLSGLGGLLGVISILALIGGIVMLLQGFASTGPGGGANVAFGISAIISSFFLLAFSFLINLFVDLEKQSRKQIELLEKLAEMGEDNNKILNVQNPLVNKSFELNSSEIDKINEDGWSQLNWEVKEGKIENVKLLLENGASINLASKFGYTPLIWAVYKGNLEIAKLLLSKGADKSILSEENKMAIDYAKEKGFDDILDLL